MQASKTVPLTVAQVNTMLALATSLWPTLAYSPKTPHLTWYVAKALGGKLEGVAQRLRAQQRRRLSLVRAA